MKTQGQMINNLPEPGPWTYDFDVVAQHEGWNVFTIDNGDLAIQKMDDMNIFADDASAIRFVKKCAKMGMPHAVAAVELVKKKS